MDDNSGITGNISIRVTAIHQVLSS